MNGLITVANECDMAKIQSYYLPIVDKVESAYRRIMGDELTSIRLMGSVARGQAILDNSDIDFCGITARSTTNSQKHELQAEMKRLGLRYPRATKVDLETESAGSIHPAREFIFRTDSLLLWGSDVYEVPPVIIPAQQLASQNTPDIDTLLKNYLTGTLAERRPDRLVQYSRWTGKDLLKCFRKYLILERNLYEKSPQKIHEQLCTYYTSESRTFNLLLSLYLDPTEQKHQIIQGIDMANESRRRLDSRGEDIA